MLDAHEAAMACMSSLLPGTSYFATNVLETGDRHRLFGNEYFSKTGACHRFFWNIPRNPVPVTGFFETIPRAHG
jgi:hypothetical protein